MAPSPIKIVCTLKPRVPCLFGSISPTRARNGSIEMLKETSIKAKKAIPIQRIAEIPRNSDAAMLSPAIMLEFGKKIKPKEAKMAPIKK